MKKNQIFVKEFKASGLFVTKNFMISLVQKYLEISYYSKHKSEFEKLFESHPNYPSLVAITDSLDLLFIVNKAVKVPKEQLPELPDSFLAIFNQNLVLVDKSNAGITILTEKGDKQNLTANEFISDWNGVILTIEPNRIILREKLKENFKGNFKALQYGLPILALIGVLGFYYSFGIYNFVSLFAPLVGLLFSAFIVKEKIS